MTPWRVILVTVLGTVLSAAIIGGGASAWKASMDIASIRQTLSEAVIPKIQDNASDIRDHELRLRGLEHGQAPNGR